METIIEKRSDKIWQTLADSRKSHIKTVTPPRAVMDLWITQNAEKYFEFGCPDYDNRYPVSTKISYPKKHKGQITDFLMEMGYTKGEIKASKCKLAHHHIWWNSDMTIGYPKKDRWGDTIEY